MSAVRAMCGRVGVEESDISNGLRRAEPGAA